MRFVHQPAEVNRLGDFLLENLRQPWTTFRAAIAFVKRSGTKHIGSPLRAFAQSNEVELIAGIDHRGTSQEGLQELLDAVSPKGRLLIFHNRLPMTFHPKVYLFKTDIAAELLVGSGNMTEGGLYSNYEASIHLKLDLTQSQDLVFLQSVESVLDRWASPSSGTTHALDAKFLTELVARGYVPPEKLSAPEGDEGEVSTNSDDEGEQKSLFAAFVEPRAPKSSSSPASTPAASPTIPGLFPPSTPAAGQTGFVMTLQKTDVGVGQTTRGTSRRSPEIFIPLSARDAAPSFWGWPDLFEETPTTYNREGIRVRHGSEIITVTLMGWKLKRDLRLRSERIRSAGQIGDLLRIEKVDGASGYDYYVEIVPQGTTQYPVYRGRCVTPVRNSEKLYGYY